MPRLHRAGVLLLAIVATVWLVSGVGAATEGDPLANINCEEVDVDEHGDEIRHIASSESPEQPERARDNGRKTVRPENLANVEEKAGDAQALNRREFDHIGNFIVIVATDQGSVVAECTSAAADQHGPQRTGLIVRETATGHGAEVSGTIFEDFPKNGSSVTFGDRDAHNVEVNVTVRGNNTGDSSEVPGVTNVAAGTNLTIVTGQGDDVSDEATSIEQGSYREGNEAPLEMELGVKIGDKVSVSGLIDEIQEDDRISLPEEEAKDISTVGQAIEYLEDNAKDGVVVVASGHGDDVSAVAWQTGEGDAGEYVVVAVIDDRGASGGDRTVANDRKTVQPRDLIIVATGQDDDILAAVQLIKKSGVREASIREAVTGHGGDVSEVAIEYENRVNATIEPLSSADENSDHPSVDDNSDASDHGEAVSGDARTSAQDGPRQETAGQTSNPATESENSKPGKKSR